MCDTKKEFLMEITERNEFEALRHLYPISRLIEIKQQDIESFWRLVERETNPIESSKRLSYEAKKKLNSLTGDKEEMTELFNKILRGE